MAGILRKSWVSICRLVPYPAQRNVSMHPVCKSDLFIKCLVYIWNHSSNRLFCTGWGEGNTLDGWPVHQRAHTYRQMQIFLHSHLWTISSTWMNQMIWSRLQHWQNLDIVSVYKVNFLPNYSFCVPWKKENHTGLEWGWGNNDKIIF